MERRRHSLHDTELAVRSTPQPMIQRLCVEKEIIQILQNKKIVTNRLVTRDFDELVQIHKGVRPRQVMEALKGCLNDYPQQSTAYRQLEAFINAIGSAETDEDLRGRSFIEHIGAVTKKGELTATFIVSQFRMETPGESYGRPPKLVMDALIISATQRLNVDWLKFGLEGLGLAIVGFLINPALGAEELVAIITGGIHVAVTYDSIRESLNEKNAKALLLQILIDRNLAKIENNTFYLTLD